MMDKIFDPAAIETRVNAAWEKAEAFKAGRKAGEAFTIVIPPPNVTGSLHMGHALNNTLQDILCRYWRMKGRDVLWQPGIDHAGIATQMVVERQMAERGEQGRREIGREAFLDKIWAWKAESGGTIFTQLKRLGASCDWSRERFTMGNRDEGEAGQMQRAVVAFFTALHALKDENGKPLLYKDKRLVNWDPKLLTAISDLEVEQKEVRGHLWYFNYPLEGVDYDPENPETFITIATTRPETMLGDGAVAVHPDNERLKHRIGQTAILPLMGRRLPIIADTYADPEKGTGAVKITSAHDFNDFEVGKRHNLPLYPIMTLDARLNDTVPEAYRGLDRYEARKRVVADIEALGLLHKIEAHTHSVPHGDRSGTVIEPMLTEQWYVNVKPLAEQAMAWVRAGETKILPANREADFFRWMENIEPWCISRQLWWGHQIPAWYGLGDRNIQSRLEVAEQVNAGVSFTVYASKDVKTGRIDAFSGVEANPYFVLEAFSPDSVQFTARKAELKQFANTEWKVVEVKDDAEAMHVLTVSLIEKNPVYPVWRDPDVLDTWFSSALWPFSTLGWPDDTAELAKYYPTSVLVTAADILFFWVARMMMAAAALKRPDGTPLEAPFHTVYLHGLVRDEKGRKMSKSVGNVLDPLVIIDALGADALRFTLASFAAQGRDPKIGIKTAESARNFCTKLWNASRFAEMNECRRVPGFNPASATSPLNRWIIGESDKALAEIEAGITGYRFNDAAAAAYRFTWNSLCDWYLELAKPVLLGPEGAERAETRATIAFLLERVVAMLHPFMPYITEELFSAYNAAAGASPRLLCLDHWPEPVGLVDATAEAEIGFVVDLISEIRSARTEMNVPLATFAPVVFVGLDGAAQARAVAAESALKRMARVSEVRFSDEAPPESVQLVVRGILACLPLEGLIDLATEKKRLAGEAEKLGKDIEATMKKLDNADFIARAPAEVVEENRERVNEAALRRTRIQEALARLG